MQQDLKDPAKDPQYKEPQIDAMRAQKDQVPPVGRHMSYYSPTTFDCRQFLWSVNAAVGSIRSNQTTKFMVVTLTVNLYIKRDTNEMR